jgi:hypothetical protein
LRRDDHLSEEGTYLVARIRGRKRKRRQARIGAPDGALTPSTGLAAITGLCDRLGVIEALDAAVGPVKQRSRGYGPGTPLRRGKTTKGNAPSTSGGDRQVRRSS